MKFSIEFEGKYYIPKEHLVLQNLYKLYPQDKFCIKFTINRNVLTAQYNLHNLSTKQALQLGADMQRCMKEPTSPCGSVTYISLD